jgi:hypothetical protein
MPRITRDRLGISLGVSGMLLCLAIGIAGLLFGNDVRIERMIALEI